MKGDPARRPVGGEDLADQVLAGTEAPAAGVAGRAAVVSHHQVVVLRDALVRVPRRDFGQGHALVATTVRLDVRLDQLPAVDVDVAVALLPDLARQTDETLDERPLRSALLLCELRCVEDDDLTALRIAEVVDETVCQHPAGRVLLAAP